MKNIFIAYKFIMFYSFTARNFTVAQLKERRENLKIKTESMIAHVLSLYFPL